MRDYETQDHEATNPKTTRLQDWKNSRFREQSTAIPRNPRSAQTTAAAAVRVYAGVARLSSDDSPRPDHTSSSAIGKAGCIVRESERASDCNSERLSSCASTVEEWVWWSGDDSVVIAASRQTGVRRSVYPGLQVLQTQTTAVLLAAGEKGATQWSPGRAAGGTESQ